MKNAIIFYEGYHYKIAFDLNNKDGICLCLSEFVDNAAHPDATPINCIVEDISECYYCIRIVATDNPSMNLPRVSNITKDQLKDPIELMWEWSEYMKNKEEANG